MIWFCAQCQLIERGFDHGPSAILAQLSLANTWWNLDRNVCIFMRHKPRLSWKEIVRESQEFDFQEAAD